MSIIVNFNNPRSVVALLRTYGDEVMDIVADRLLDDLAAFNAKHASDNGDDVPDRYDMRDANDQEGWR